MILITLLHAISCSVSSVNIQNADRDEGTGMQQVVRMTAVDAYASLLDPTKWVGQ